MSAPIRLDFIKQTVRDIFAAQASELAADRFVWVRQGIPRPRRPYVSMQILTGPFSDMTKEENRFREVIDSVNVAVNTVTVGLRYRIRVNGFPVDYTAIGGDTATTIRDGLLANATDATNFATGEDVTFAPVPVPPSMVITPDSPGELVSVENPTPELSLITSKSDAWVVYTIARDMMTIQVTAYATDAIDEDLSSAMMISRRLQKGLDKPDTEDILLSARIGMRQISNIVDLSGLEPGGAKLQGQSQFDVEVTASSLSITQVNPIDSVEITLDISGSTETFTTP